MSTMTMYAKMTVDQGRSPGLSRQDFEAALETHASALFPQEKSVAKRVSLALGGISGVAADPEALLLFRASKIAPAELPSAPTPAVYSPGKAEAEMNKAVEELMKAQPKLTKAAAFTTIYTSAAHVDLKKRYDAEQAALPAEVKLARSRVAA